MQSIKGEDKDCSAWSERLFITEQNETEEGQQTTRKKERRENQREERDWFRSRESQTLKMATVQEYLDMSGVIHCATKATRRRNSDNGQLLPPSLCSGKATVSDCDWERGRQGKRKVNDREEGERGGAREAVGMKARLEVKRREGKEGSEKEGVKRGE